MHFVSKLILTCSTVRGDRVGYGESETVNAMALLRSDALDLFEAMHAGTLKIESVALDTSSACVVKVLAPFSYPDKPLVGETIDVSALQQPSCLLVHSAEMPAPGKLVTKGDRLAAVVAVAPTLSLTGVASPVGTPAWSPKSVSKACATSAKFAATATSAGFAGAPRVLAAAL